MNWISHLVKLFAFSFEELEAFWEPWCAKPCGFQLGLHSESGYAEWGEQAAQAAQGCSRKPALAWELPFSCPSAQIRPAVGSKNNHLNTTDSSVCHHKPLADAVPGLSSHLAGQSLWRCSEIKYIDQTLCSPVLNFLFALFKKGLCG